MNPVLSCKDVSCHRENWNETGQSASIENVTASFDLGMVCEFDGPDAAGRGLLLSVLGLLESADSGGVHVDGRGVADLANEDLQRLRARTFGFLFHNPCLLPSFSVAENVAMPLFRICGIDADAARERTIEVLDFCGIAHLENQLAGRPGRLRRSGAPRLPARWSIARRFSSPSRLEKATSFSILPCEQPGNWGFACFGREQNGTVRREGATPSSNTRRADQPRTAIL